jgi:hypothetical protein
MSNNTTRMTTIAPSPMYMRISFGGSNLAASIPIRSGVETTLSGASTTGFVPRLVGNHRGMYDDDLQSDELESVARYLGMAVAGDAITLETAARALAECTGSKTPARVTDALIASSCDRREAWQSQPVGQARRG